MSETSKSLLVLAGTSGIGRAIALAFARAGWTIALAGRDLDRLGRVGEDIARATGGPVAVHRFDVLETAAFPGFVDGLPALPDAVVSAVGLLDRDDRTTLDPERATLVLRTDLEGPALILALFAERFAARGSGTIVGISSVAGERGRRANLVYGSAKAGFTAFLSGLRGRFFAAGVTVITVKPGWVRTAMIEGLAIPDRLVCEPEDVAADGLAAVNGGRLVVFSPWWWRPIMTIARLLPERIFRRLTV